MTTSVVNSVLHDLFTNDHVQIVRNFCPDSEILRTAIEDSFTKFDTSINVPKLRFYWDSGLREDHKFDVLSNPRNSTERISGWLTRLFGELRDYCLVVNGVTCWSPVVHQFVATEVIAPWINVRGKNFKPFDAYAFLGEYAFTPFGVHSDGEDSILIHLGPSDKTVFYWPDFSPQSAAWRTAMQVNRFDVHAYPSPPIAITLSSGDLIKIPKGHPHVMTNDHYSATLGVIPNPSNECEATKMLVDELMREIEPISIDGFADSERAFSKLSHSLEMLTDSSNTFRALETLQMRLNSNGWIMPAPNLNSLMQCEDMEQWFQCDTVNPVLHQQFGDELIVVFCRGRDLKLPYNDRMLSTLRALEDGQKFNMSKFKAFLQPFFDDLAAEKVFSMLIRLGGVIPCNRNG